MRAIWHLPGVLPARPCIRSHSAMSAAMPYFARTSITSSSGGRDYPRATREAIRYRSRTLKMVTDSLRFFG